jgi:hypothetical protein
VRVRCGEEADEEREGRNDHPKPPPHDATYRSCFIQVMSRTVQCPRYNRGMTTVASSVVAVLAVAAVVGTGSTVTRHEVTHNGTVIALKTSRYAQPTGGARDARELEVMVVDSKTKKPSTRVFTITDRTRLLRGGRPLKAAELTAQKDEKVAVVVDHDKPGDEAIEVRFTAAQ